MNRSGEPNFTAKRTVGSHFVGLAVATTLIAFFSGGAWGHVGEALCLESDDFGNTDGCVYVHGNINDDVFPSAEYTNHIPVLSTVSSSGYEYLEVRNNLTQVFRAIDSTDNPFWVVSYEHGDIYMSDLGDNVTRGAMCRDTHGHPHPCPPPHPQAARYKNEAFIPDASVRLHVLKSADADYTRYKLYFRRGPFWDGSMRTLFRVEGKTQRGNWSWIRWHGTDPLSLQVVRSNGTPVTLTFDNAGRMIGTRFVNQWSIGLRHIGADDNNEQNHTWTMQGLADRHIRDLLGSVQFVN